jgi:hypothetical protein
MFHGACLTLIALRKLPAVRVVLLGLVLATISGVSDGLHDPSLSWSLQEGLAVWACFVAGAMLFKNQASNAVRAFQPPLAGLGRNLVFGVLVAAPLAIINNLYFYLNAGSIQFQNGLRSASEALSPAIHSEPCQISFVDSAPSPSVQETCWTRKSVLAVARMELFAYSIGRQSVDSFCGMREKVQETH